MCMMLYLTSHKELPTIPWKEHEKLFSLMSLEKPANSFYEKAKAEIIIKTSGKYIYSVLAHTGCGCGFSYGINEIFDEDGQIEEEKNRKSIELLLKFLKEHVKQGEKLELYTCIAEKEGNSEYKKSKWNVSEIGLGENFELKDGELIEIIS